MYKKYIAVLVLQVVGIVKHFKEMFVAGTGIEFEPKIPHLFSSQVLVH